MRLKETKFREQVASMLSNPPFNHDIYFHEGNYRQKFSIRNSPGYIDLLALTNPTWQYHPEFPLIGIETKIAYKLGWLINTIGQLDKYYKNLRTAHYYIGKKEIEPPRIFLVVTDDLIDEGYFYCWEEPRIITHNNEFKLGWWEGLTEFYDRILWKRGAALLRKDYFLYKQKRYNLV